VGFFFTDWDLTQEELEFNEINNDESDEEVLPKISDPMDLYRISGFGKFCSPKMCKLKIIC
jgi:hypothetical protein